MELKLNTPLVSDRNLLHSFTSASNKQYRFLVTNNDDSKVIAVWTKGKTVGLARNKMGVTYTDVTLPPGNYDVDVQTTEGYTIVVSQREWWKKAFGGILHMLGIDIN